MKGTFCHLLMPFSAVIVGTIKCLPSSNTLRTATIGVMEAITSISSKFKAILHYFFEIQGIVMQEAVSVQEIKRQ